MRLRSVRLVNFRGVRDARVEFRTPGLTVVLADNETGKSSILEALDKLFYFPDTSQSRELLAVQPVGRDVATTVEAELDLGGHRVRYRKTWFRDRASELTVDGRATTGRAAHDAAAALFAEHVDRHLWQALVVDQSASLDQPVARRILPLLTVLSRDPERAGNAVEPEPEPEPDELDALGQATLPGFGSIVLAQSPETRVREPASRPADARSGGAEARSGAGGRSGGTPDDTDDRSIEAVLALGIDREYQRYFTPGTGRVSGELAEVQAAVADAQAEADRSAEAVAVVERTVEDAEGLAARRDELLERRAAQRALIEQLAARRRQAELAQAQLARAVSERDLAVERAVGAAIAGRTRSARIAGADAAARATAAAADRLATGQAQLSGSEAEHARAAQCRTEAADGLERARTALERARRRDALRRDTEALQVLDKRLEAAAAAQADQARARTEADTAAVDPETVDRVVGLAHRLSVAEASAERVAATVVVRRLGNAVVAVVGGAADGGEPIRVGDEIELTATELIGVRVDGIVDVTVHPAAAAVAEVTAARSQLASALAAVGADDVEAVRERGRTRHESLARAAAAAERARPHLGGATVEDLREVRARLAAEIVEVSAEVTADAEGGADQDASAAAADVEARSAPSTVPLRRLEQVVADAVRRCGELDAVVRTRGTELEQARTGVATAAVRLDEARRRERDAVGVLEADRHDVADADVLRAVEVAAVSAEAADGAVRSVAVELEAGGLDTASADHLAALAEEGRLEAELALVNDAWSRAQARLDDAGARGLATASEVAQGRLDQAHDRQATVRQRADAVSLLRSTMTTHMTAARRRYADPLRTTIDDLGAAVFGPTFAVTLSDDLEVIERHLDGTVMPVAWLSTGAREQLAIVVRMAIARLTVDDGGAPLILDDVLGWSDPSRLHSLHRLLGDAARDQQVIVLTSQWERYADVPGVGDPVRLRAS